MPSDVTRRLIPWQRSRDGGACGRHVSHDLRSWGYRVARKVGPLRSVRHKRLVGTYDQHELGSCVPHAGKGVLSTRPFGHRFASEAGIVRTYIELTASDDIPGYYKPDDPNSEDTGSDGLSFAKLAVRKGWCSSYVHAFGIDDLLSGLQDRAGMAGTDWLDGMDRPDADGRVHPVGDVRGGHEYVADAYEQHGTVPDIHEDRIWFEQSWGQWGLNGRFYVIVADFAGLLDRQGDATFLIA